MAEISEQQSWAIIFDDAGVPPEIYTSEAIARKRLTDLQYNWSCHLFAPMAAHDKLRAELEEVREDKTVSIAEALARAGHVNQRCTVTGEPYILHVERVASMVDSPEEKAVAWLHDLIEDTYFGVEELRAAGFPDNVVYAVLLVTKVKGQAYSEYIEVLRESRNTLAISVKSADLKDHLKPNCPQRLRQRYLDACRVLSVPITPEMEAEHAK